MQNQTRYLAIVNLAAVFALGLAALVGAEPEAAKSSHLGSWELAKIKYGDATDFSDFPKERRRLKLITETYWSWVEYDTAGKKEVKQGAGGPYTLKDGTYTETMEFATGEYMLTLLDK